MVISLLIGFLLPVIGMLLISAVVLLNNYKSSKNRYFAFLSLATACWLTLIFLADRSTDYNQALLLVKCALASSKVMAIAFVLFCLNFPVSISVKIPKWIFIVPALILMPVALTDQVIYSVSQDSTGTSIAAFSGLYTLDTVVMLMYFLAGSIILLRQKVLAKNSERDQINYVLVGILLALGVNLFTNYLYPLITGNDSINVYGNLALLIFVSFTAYAIIRHRLFDIRLIVARSLAYVLSIGILVLVLALSSTLIAQALFGDTTTNVQLLVLNTAVFIVAVLIYPIVKRFFDKATNRFFYRDAYEPQTFLDDFNKAIVSNIETGILLRHTTAVISTNLKADCYIHVNATEVFERRIAGTKRISIEQDIIDLVGSEMESLEAKIIRLDEISDEHSGLRETMIRNNLSVIAKLSTDYAGKKEATAFLLFSPKFSGNAYSKQDMRIITIIADELLIAIQNALRFEEIQSFNITLQNRINDATAKLKRGNEKLKEMDEAKDEFISMASHQLRTPLTSVKGYLSMVLDGDAGKLTDTQQQLLNQAFVSSQRMVYLIADLLNVSRLKTGKFIINASPTNLADMVESEIAQLKEVAKSRKLTLTFNKPDNFPILDLDETKTRQVVMNFVDNAIYYTPANGKIRIELKTDRSSVYFMVKDNGMGVPKSEQGQLFTKFYRAKNAQQARPDGTGLGLFMAKKVITDQGGTILFESTEGKGSTFGFKFDKPSNKK